MRNVFDCSIGHHDTMKLSPNYHCKGWKRSVLIQWDSRAAAMAAQANCLDYALSHNNALDAQMWETKYPINRDLCTAVIEGECADNVILWTLSRALSHSIVLL